MFVIVVLFVLVCGLFFYISDLNRRLRVLREAFDEIRLSHVNLQYRIQTLECGTDEWGGGMA